MFSRASEDQYMAPSVKSDAVVSLRYLTIADIDFVEYQLDTSLDIFINNILLSALRKPSV